MSDAFAGAQLTARQLQEQTGLSLRELAEMDLSDFARLAYGQTPAEAAIAAFNADQDAQYQRQDPAPQQAPAPAQPQASETRPGIDIAGMDMATYAAYRQQAGIGQPRQEGIGIMNSGAGTQDWIAAASGKSGRHGWNQRGVEESPDMTRQQLPTRPAEGRNGYYR